MKLIYHRSIILIVLVLSLLLTPTVSSASPIHKTADEPVIDKIVIEELSYEEEKQLAVKEQERPLSSDENHNPYPLYPDNIYPSIVVEEVQKTQRAMSGSLSNRNDVAWPMPTPVPPPPVDWKDDILQEKEDPAISVDENVDLPTEYSVNNLQDKITETALGDLPKVSTIDTEDQNESILAFQEDTQSEIEASTDDIITPTDEDATIVAQVANASGGSLTITNITSNSVLATYSTPKGASNARLESYNGVAGWQTHATIGGAINSAMYIRNMNIGEEYMFRLAYWYGSGFQVVDEYITTQLPVETYQALTGSRITLMLEPYMISKFASGKASAWLAKLDKGYYNLQTLTDGDPEYGVGDMIVQSTRDPVSYWAKAGQPILWNSGWVPAQINDINNKNDASFGILHEISHNYDSYRWNFDSEFWANFKMVYIIEANNYQVQWGGNTYTASTMKNFYKSYCQTPHDTVMSTGKYNNDALTYTMLRIKDRVGWYAFTQTFNHFRNLHYIEVPNTNIDKLNLFLSKLKDFSGVDVFTEFTARERQIYESAFGDTIRYTDPMTFTLQPSWDKSVTNVLADTMKYHSALTSRAFIPFRETLDISFYNRPSRSSIVEWYIVQAIPLSAISQCVAAVAQRTTPMQSVS